MNIRQATFSLTGLCCAAEKPQSTSEYDLGPHDLDKT
jgi:hypothetical protein